MGFNIKYPEASSGRRACEATRRCIDIIAVNTVAFAFAEGCNDAGGGIVGGQIGYRWQSAA